MKKILGLLAIVMMIGGCAQQTNETSQVYTGSQAIDLSNCTSYFDGCNNCVVENGQVTACTLMYCETYAEPKCTQTKDQEPNNSDTPNTDTTITNDQIEKNCTSYFDGCNNCMVENGEIKGCTKKFCQTPEQPKCLEYTPTEDQTVCTMEYAPVCAEVAIQCVQAPCEPIQQTFGNKCMMNANKLANFLHEGECSSSK